MPLFTEEQVEDKVEEALAILEQKHQAYVDGLLKQIAALTAQLEILQNKRPTEEAAIEDETYTFEEIKAMMKQVEASDLPFAEKFKELERLANINNPSLLDKAREWSTTGRTQTEGAVERIREVKSTSQKGFLKGLGKGVGQITGGIVRGTINFVGELADSKAFKEIGEGVYHASSKAGETVGAFASGVTDVIGGIVTKDGGQLYNGFNDMGTAVSDTCQGIKAGVMNVVDNGGKVIDGIKNDDYEAIKEGGMNLIKTTAVATFAIGVADFVGVVGDDGVAESAGSGSTDHFDTTAPEVQEVGVSSVPVAEPGQLDQIVATVENPNNHHVDPHWVNDYYREDGTHVEGYWRGGNSGWEQSNPDYKAEKI